MENEKPVIWKGRTVSARDIKWTALGGSKRSEILLYTKTEEKGEMKWAPFENYTKRADVDELLLDSIKFGVNRIYGYRSYIVIENGEFHLFGHRVADNIYAAVDAKTVYLGAEVRKGVESYISNLVEHYIDVETNIKRINTSTASRYSLNPLELHKAACFEVDGQEFLFPFMKGDRNIRLK